MTTYMYFLVHVRTLNKDILWFHQMQTFYFSFCIFSILADIRSQLCFVGSHMPVSGYIYTGQASMDMDISMDIHAKSVDVDMDVDGKFHIHGNPEQEPGESFDTFLGDLRRLVSGENLSIRRCGRLNHT